MTMATSNHTRIPTTLTDVITVLSREQLKAGPGSWSVST